MSQLSWCIMGDFNDMLESVDKKGRVEYPRWLLNSFRELSMIVIFMICRWRVISIGGVEGRVIMMQLRRGLIDQVSGYMDLFPSAILSTCMASISDHWPLLLKLDGSMFPRSRATFKFENSWLHEESLCDTIVESWGGVQTGSILEKKKKGIALMN